MDAPIFAAYHLPSFVAKSGIAYLPIIGTVARGLQCVWVNRFSSDSRRDASAQLVRRIEYSRKHSSNGSGDAYPHVMLFPEGACTNGKALIAFKPGAFRPGQPVQPVTLRYPYTYYNPVSYPLHHLCSYHRYTCMYLLFIRVCRAQRLYHQHGINNWIMHLRYALSPHHVPLTPITLFRTNDDNCNDVQTLCQLNNELEVEYLPVYYPSDAERADAQLYANNVRAAMARSLNIPTVDATIY